MAKIKKPAPKGGKKNAAPKKVAKRAPAKKKLTARQIDQFNADKMRAESLQSATKTFVATPDDIARLKKTFVAVKPFVIPAHPTVEEQWDQSLVDAKRQGRVWAELAASTMAGVNLADAVSEPPKKKSLWHRFRSAVSGLFVSKKFAEANPDTTVREKAD